MPLDRLIEVTYLGVGTRNMYGEYITPAPRKHRVWANQKDRDLTHVIESGGKRGERRRDWRIRWHEEIAYADTSLLTVEDFTSEDVAGHHIVWSVVNMVEVEFRDGQRRRRWLDIQGLWSG